MLFFFAAARTRNSTRCGISLLQALYTVSMPVVICGGATTIEIWVDALPKQVMSDSIGLRRNRAPCVEEKRNIGHREGRRGVSNHVTTPVKIETLDPIYPSRSRLVCDDCLVSPVHNRNSLRKSSPALSSVTCRSVSPKTCCQRTLSRGWVVA